ncbi:SpoIIE family protein phosphatase [Desulfocurvibacter africanus]|uniref:SpoIIE family protein phosphatase n=1 Tax=Desulfocurvibacter africanus TaxID=873 RepID=UPI00041961EB|nr:SpoIIE family protein phosphatase [Desulfocurvibacter africanus]
MRILWKTLILLLGISLVPLLLVTGVSHRAMRAMGTDLAEQGRGSLLERTSTALQRMVEDHARVLRLEMDVLALVLQSGAKDIRELARTGELACPPSGDRGAACPAPEAMRPERFVSIESVFAPMQRKYASLVHWQAVLFEDGRYSVFPEHFRVDLGQMRNLPWVRLGLGTREPKWSDPHRDPLTGNVVFTVTRSLYSHEEQFLGVSAVSVSVDTVLKENIHTHMLSPNLVFFMAAPEAEGGPDDGLIKIIAQRSTAGHKDVRWSVPDKPLWLASKDEAGLAALASDLRQDRNGVRLMPFDARLSVWVYARIPEMRSYLFFVIPASDVTREAEAVEAYVRDRVGQQERFSMAVVAVVGLLALAAALAGARTITRRIGNLVSGVRRVAAGDFEARVPVEGRDEIGELSTTFNRMVPALQDSVRIRQGLMVAQEVQQHLLPVRAPVIAGLDVAAASLYSDETGGDYYDFFDVCCRDPNILTVAVGDVSGHGLQAALLMATVRAALRGRLTQSGSMAEALRDVNRLVAVDTRETGQFVTLIYAQVHSATRTIRWIRAGHEPGFLYDPVQDEFVQLRGPGVALGLDGDMVFKEQVATYPEGGILVLGTDGITEAHNAAGEMFGRHRLENVIRTSLHFPAKRMVEIITEAVREFQGGMPQEDDLTLVVIKDVRVA